MNGSEPADDGPETSPDALPEPASDDTPREVPAPEATPEASSEPAADHAEPMTTASPAPRTAPRHAARGVTHEGQALVAQGLELTTPHGRVFGPVDWVLPPRTHGAVLGVQGSGRSAFLLAITGRMRGLTGTLRVGDLDGLRQPRLLRHRSAVARITDLVELEPDLTVAEAADEHALADGIGVRRGRESFMALQEAIDHHFAPSARVDTLSAYERTLLAALLACQRPAHHIVLDDVDDALTVPQLQELYRAMDLLGTLGHSFVVSALESSPLPRGAAVLHLPPPQTREALSLSFGHLRPRVITQES